MLPHDEQMALALSTEERMVIEQEIREPH
jgi:hypothetical protein